MEQTKWLKIRFLPVFHFTSYASADSPPPSPNSNKDVYLFFKEYSLCKRVPL